MKFGLAQPIIDKLIAIFEQYPKVNKALVFGSRAKGNFRPDSDIDIAIKGQDLNTDDIIAMSVAFEEKGTTHKIDLINYDTIKEPDLKDHIDRVGIELYSRWKEFKLGDIADITSSKRIFFSDYVSSGIPFYRSKEIIEKAQGDDISIDLFITKEKFYAIKEKFGAPLNGDILISAVGERAGIPYCVNNDGDFYFKDGNLIWFRNFNSEISSNFLVYYFNSSIGQQRLESTMIGSAQKALTIIGLKNLEVAFPPIKEQTIIVSTLRSLDNKIDLLHRQNKTLEQLAETLFRQWFVEEAEESWEKTTLYDSIKLIGGGTPKTENASYWNGDIPWLSGGDIASNHKSFVMKTEKTISEAGLNNSSAKLLPTFSTIISARGTVGKYCLLSEPMTFSQSNYGVLPKYMSCFFFTYLLIAYSVDELQSAAYGSVFDTITTNTFKGHEIFLPPKSTIEMFEKMIEPYLLKIKSNQKQIRTLTQTRDTLLPKLMSGEVKVNLN
jgi:type I restriction enzyme S subunit